MKYEVDKYLFDDNENCFDDSFDCETIECK